MSVLDTDIVCLCMCMIHVCAGVKGAACNV